MCVRRCHPEWTRRGGWGFEFRLRTFSRILIVDAVHGYGKQPFSSVTHPMHGQIGEARTRYWRRWRRRRRCWVLADAAMVVFAAALTESAGGHHVEAQTAACTALAATTVARASLLPTLIPAFDWFGNHLQPARDRRLVRSISFSDLLEQLPPSRATLCNLRAALRGALSGR